MKMSGRRQLESKYVEWYRIIERVFGTYVPHLSDDEIPNYVSNKDWMIIPLPGEADKNKAKLAPRPNLYIDLSQDNIIRFGIVYEKLDSVARLRNTLLPFNERERNELITKLATLDDSFVTTVDRKVKEHHPKETPDYTTVFEEKCNRIDYEEFIKVFKAVDKIIDERDLLDSTKKYQLAPTVGLVYGRTERDKNAFTQALSKIKPIYEMTVKAKTKEQYEVCWECLCLECAEKEEHDCRCPCAGYPKSPDITTLCNLRKGGTEASTT